MTASHLKKLPPVQKKETPYSMVELPLYGEILQHCHQNPIQGRSFQTRAGIDAACMMHAKAFNYILPSCQIAFSSTHYSLSWCSVLPALGSGYLHHKYNHLASEVCFTFPSEQVQAPKKSISVMRPGTVNAPRHIAMMVLQVVFQSEWMSDIQNLL
jgi:hypothetical protein